MRRVSYLSKWFVHSISMFYWIQRTSSVNCAHETSKFTDVAAKALVCQIIKPARSAPSNWLRTSTCCRNWEWDPRTPPDGHKQCKCGTGTGLTHSLPLSKNLIYARAIKHASFTFASERERHRHDSTFSIRRRQRRRQQRHERPSQHTLRENRK